MNKTRKPSLISIIIPLFNEEEIIRETYNRLKTLMDGKGFDYEIIFVDDGSTDNSMNILKDLRSDDNRVKIISFSRNFGHQAALTAGLEHAKGDVAITMDADLQHPPELIPRMIEKWLEGFDVVFTVREYEGEGLFKRLSSRGFYWLIDKLAKINIPADSADFKLFDRKVVESLCSLGERNRFLRGLSSWVGFRQTGIGFKSPPRPTGESKYNLSKMISLALAGLTSFSVFPLRLAVYMGFIVSIISFIYLAYALYIRLIADKALPGWASIVIPMLFLGGIQLLTIGILGEYIGRVYEEVKGRPIYIVKEKIGIE